MKKHKKILKELKRNKKFLYKIYQDSLKTDQETYQLITWATYAEAHNMHEIARRIKNGIDL